ncbi:MAG: plasmid encoded RepA protein [Acetobacteraceae bacterium]|nr:MAG: plasmid encoded RepA protein [Acetobacteraceae bacterium]
MASNIQQRLLDLAVDIAGSAPEDLAFHHSIMTQASLPTSKPPEGLLVWERQQGRARLRVEAGSVLDPKTGQYVQPGLPYGPKARLLLMHLNSEAVRRQSPVIPVEDTMTAFFRRLMGRKQDGRQANMLKAQLSALSAATFRLGILQGDDRAFQVDTKVVSAFELWFQKDDSQRVIWPSTLRLSLDYFDSLTRFAVPLDERAIAALAHSATALDIYCWLAQRLHRIPAGKLQFVPWTALYDQFGQGYREIRKFRRDFLKQMVQVKAVYPDAKLSDDRRGMTLETSPPPISKRLITVPALSIGEADS